MPTRSHCCRMEGYLSPSGVLTMSRRILIGKAPTFFATSHFPSRYGRFSRTVDSAVFRLLFHGACRRPRQKRRRHFPAVPFSIGRFDSDGPHVSQPVPKSYHVL